MWVKIVSKERGLVYYINIITGKTVCRMDSSGYSPSTKRRRKDQEHHSGNESEGEEHHSGNESEGEESIKTEIVVNTLDGQITIPRDALNYLNDWSEVIGMLTPKYIPTLNVSSSYLLRLISIARFYLQLFVNEKLVEQNRDRLRRMVGAYYHPDDEFTNFFNEEMKITSSLLSIIEGITDEKTSQPMQTDSTQQMTYTTMNTLDGQVRIPGDALPNLKEWSRMIMALTTHFNQGKIPTLYVPSSYLIRLICIARACQQYEKDNNEKKKEQIIRMFDAHISDEFTSFYNDEIDMLKENKLVQFMNSINFKRIDIWSLPDSFSHSGIEIDTMDPRFTLQQYTAIIVLSYFEYLKITNPQKVKGLDIDVSLEQPNEYYIEETQETIDETQEPIKEWVPIEEMWIPKSPIKIGNIEISLYSVTEEIKVGDKLQKRIKYYNIINILHFSIEYNAKKNDKLSPNEISFLINIFNIFMLCWEHPDKRKWSELKRLLE
uniref:Uncharacterized protein n=1 Tax=viral metagenome TaxID=1070528 RepID=A0A6C0H4G4_9ZZZZ